MRLDKKLNLWESHSLISAEQKKQIIEFENSHKKPLFFIGMTLYGFWTIGLGIISLIAANWEHIPASLKLFCDLLLLVATAYGTMRAQQKNKGLWFEGGIIVLFMLCGASIGLIGQIFQTNGTFIGMAVFWCFMTLPLLTISYRKILPFIWIALLALGIGTNEFFLDRVVHFVENLIILNQYPEIGLIVLVVLGGILAGFFSMSDYILQPKYQIFKVAVFYAYVIIYTAALVYMFAACDFSHHIYSHFFINTCVLLFILFTTLAYIGDRFDRPRQVNGNIVLLYILFLIIYFRIIGSLTLTGIGLIINGVVIIGGLHLTRKIIKKIQHAPQKEKHNAKI